MLIKPLKIKDLLSYIESDEFKNSRHIPISSIRARSQCHNPKANPDDTALIIAYEGNEIIGYIGLLPDQATEAKIFWNSCWWADADKGRYAAIPLLLAAIKASRGNLLITDLTGHTSKLIKQLSFFKFSKPIQGIKLFLNFRLHEILPTRVQWTSRFRVLLRFADAVLNAFVKPFFQKEKSLPGYVRVEYVRRFDQEMAAFIEKVRMDEFISRSVVDLNWILEHPWIQGPDQDKKQETPRYHFSSFEKGFDYRLLKCYKEKELFAVLLFRRRGGHILLPYCYFAQEDARVVMDLIRKLLQDWKAVTFESYHPFLVPLLKRGQGSIFKREVKKDFVYHKTMEPMIPFKPCLQDGDGDVVFT